MVHSVELTNDTTVDDRLCPGVPSRIRLVGGGSKVVR